MVKPQIHYVACIGLTGETADALLGKYEGNFHFLKFDSTTEFLSVAQDNRQLFQTIMFECNNGLQEVVALKKQLTQMGFWHVPFVIVAEKKLPVLTAKFLQGEGVAELFLKPLTADVVIRKLRMIRESRPVPQSPAYEYKIPLGKRIFDIVFASLALLLLSPLFAIITLLIRLQSKGPVFYYSLRVGTGYRIFKFYKFRSMAVDADKKLSQLKHLNQYGESQTVATAKVKQLCDACARTKSACQSALYADNEMWCEKLYKDHLHAKGQQAFIKIKDDPRITPIGKFIRNTSIDELPQLWNVIKGDMSLVGNRPLPLYEAEKLTTDKYALRFMAPAGITGLWQVSKRGGGSMSEEERISLDNDYAKSYGLFFDIKLLLRTIPALLQKENV